MNPSEAVRELRQRRGESQQAFATAAGLSIRAIANYEAGRTPQGRALAQLAGLAKESGHPDVEAVLRRALIAEMSLNPFTDRSKGHFAADWGYATFWFEGDEETRFGEACTTALMGLRAKQPAVRKKCRQALEALKTAMSRLPGGEE